MAQWEILSIVPGKILWRKFIGGLGAKINRALMWNHYRSPSPFGWTFILNMNKLLNYGQTLNYGWTFELWVNFWTMAKLLNHGRCFELWVNFWIMGELLKYGWTFKLWVHFELWVNFSLGPAIRPGRVMVLMCVSVCLFFGLCVCVCVCLLLLNLYLCNSVICISALL